MDSIFNLLVLSDQHKEIKFTLRDHMKEQQTLTFEKLVADMVFIFFLNNI